jgi:hypothetical protein
MKSGVSSLPLLAALMACACSGNQERTICDDAQDVIKQAVDDYCSERDDQCWYCKCHNRGQDVGVEIGTSNYYCTDPDPCQDDPDTSENECKCDGTNESEAQACLKDIEQCQAPFLAHAVSACNGTPI